MVKEIIKDEFFLKQKSKSCTKEDLYIANELLETIQAYKEQCVGMAANMIGYLKTMMVVLDENKYFKNKWKNVSNRRRLSIITRCKKDTKI